MSLGHFDFFRFLAVLLAFVGNSAVLATPLSQNSAVLATPLSQNSAVLATPLSQNSAVLATLLSRVSSKEGKWQIANYVDWLIGYSTVSFFRVLES